MFDRRMPIEFKVGLITINFKINWEIELTMCKTSTPVFKYFLCMIIVMKTRQKKLPVLSRDLLPFFPRDLWLEDEFLRCESQKMWPYISIINIHIFISYSKGLPRSFKTMVSSSALLECHASVVKIYIYPYVSARNQYEWDCFLHSIRLAHQMFL